ncbi:hypothetical protein ELAC_0454 [Estrella lausannensis]|uniref:Uncharacterized protein n=1 Tax=Estrella lausannensis TaxID=483423 RepID=A0A0H5DQH3_9BACT|nr:hypothetical protein ELAC_0454 [Estrella lausannensis]
MEQQSRNHVESVSILGIMSLEKPSRLKECNLSYLSNNRSLTFAITEALIFVGNPILRRFRHEYPGARIRPGSEVCMLL